MKVVQTLVLGILLILTFGTSFPVQSQETEKRQADHRWTMTCKAESIIDLFPNSEKRREAIEWMKKHGIEKVWLETFRHGREADTELLKTVRDEFTAAGFDVGGCITPTTKDFTPLLACFGNRENLELFARLAEKTASLFDEIILDDFVFTGCTCDTCSAEKSERRIKSWEEFRRITQLELGKKYIVDPAKRTNPNVRVIIKFPCWYEKYAHGGYDILNASSVYDGIGLGTETREPQSDAAGRIPQTQASWITGWFLSAVGNQLDFVWFDPIDTKPETYVEQARQSILGGSPETLLHCYDYLGTDTPGIALHGTDTQLKFGKADAEAFNREREKLQQLAELLAGKEPIGVLAPKKPNDDPETDSKFLGFVGMLGIPVRPASSLSGTEKRSIGAILGSQAIHFNDLDSFLAKKCAAGEPLFITEAFEKETELSTRSANRIRWGKDIWELMDIPQSQLDELRNIALKPFGIRLSAPSKVSIHLFVDKNADSLTDNSKENLKKIQIIAVENFQDEPVDLQLSLENNQPWKTALAFPTGDAVQSDGIKSIHLEKRSLAVLAL